MSVSLKKGQKIDLTKGNSGLKRLIVGLGWDEAPGLPSSQKSVGLLKNIFGSYPNRKRGTNVDCDASALVLTNGKLLSQDDLVYFCNLSHNSNCIIHQGDNLTGAGDGDDEQIFVDLEKMPSQYDKIVFVVNIYKAGERNQHFEMIKNAFIRLVNKDNQQELCKYNLSEDYTGMTAMIFGELYRQNGEWKFNAIGQAVTDTSLESLANRYK